MEPDIIRLCNELFDKAKGKARLDIVDDCAYPVPVMVICKIQRTVPLHTRIGL